MESFPDKRVIAALCAVTVFYVVLRDVPEDVSVPLLALTLATLALWVAGVVLRAGMLNLCEFVVLMAAEKLLDMREARQLREKANDARRRDLGRRELYVAN